METIQLPEIIAEHLEELRALCREYGVARLEIFGSAVNGEFDPETSDVDFLVTYPADYEFGPWLGRFQELDERLEQLFRRDIDLIMSKEFKNPFFARSVNESRRTVYVATNI